MLPAMLLYLVFFLLQTSIKSNGGKGKMDPAIWMWAINLLYFALAVLLNLCRTRCRCAASAPVLIKEQPDAGVWRT
ncbi:hypothetical protein MJ390_03645 [Klebsiella pneumoniae]|nr:hypothetical protein MJ390_03645 [Klebsiella pneumoniae]